MRVLCSAHLYVLSSKRQKLGILRGGWRLAVDGQEDRSVIAQDNQR